MQVLLQVADYAFTTLRPQLGMLHYPDTASLAIADIPGLIKGASDNRGLGHRFLRHVERSQALAYVLDLSSGIKPHTGPNAKEQFSLLQVWQIAQQVADEARGMCMYHCLLWIGHFPELGA